MFYENVKHLCAERGIAITTLALKLGFSRSAPNAWRNMTNPPRAATVKKVAEYFKVSPESLTDLTVREAPSISRDAQTEEMMRLFERLSVMDKAKVLLYTNDLLKTEKEN